MTTPTPMTTITRTMAITTSITTNTNTKTNTSDTNTYATHPLNLEIHPLHISKEIEHLVTIPNTCCR
eukprot:m.212224 g.212224  ORF g.212224 m.212224 type:complete len:67 (-) comp33120_c7_seq1:45-245(-)